VLTKGVEYHTVRVDDKLVSQQIEDIQRRYGKMISVDEAGPKDLVVGTFTELEADGSLKSGGISHSTTLSIEFIENVDAKQALIGKKQADQFSLDPSTVSKDGLTWPITGGKLKGLFENETQLNSFKGTMDTFANQLRNLVNTIHEGGISNGATGRNFFNDSSPQTGARDFDLDPGILTNASLIATGTTSAKGDGSIALALSDLRNTAQAGLGNQTIGNFFSSFLGVVGSAVNTAKNNVETSYALTEQVDQQIQETSGVNLDDEMADMLKFQRSYQAAAKVLTMMDQNVGDLIDMLRR
jgi:flagellar hook-associated protein FlgK